MGSNRITIWRFEDAPARLRSLHAGASEPDWLVLVPRSFHSPDVDEAIVRGAVSVSRFDAPGGDIVYVGMATMGLPQSPSPAALVACSDAASTGGSRPARRY